MIETTYAAFSLGQLFVSNALLLAPESSSIYFDFLLVIKVFDGGKTATLMTSTGRKFYTVTVDTTPHRVMLDNYCLISSRQHCM